MTDASESSVMIVIVMTKLCMTGVSLFFYSNSWRDRIRAQTGWLAKTLLIGGPLMPAAVFGFAGFYLTNLLLHIVDMKNTCAFYPGDCQFPAIPGAPYECRYEDLDSIGPLLLRLFAFLCNPVIQLLVICRYAVSFIGNEVRNSFCWQSIFLRVPSRPNQQPLLALSLIDLGRQEQQEPDAAPLHHMV